MGKATNIDYGIASLMSTRWLGDDRDLDSRDDTLSLASVYMGCFLDRKEVNILLDAINIKKTGGTEKKIEKRMPDLTYMFTCAYC